MPNLLFIHGIGVRGDAWFRGFELISRKAEQFLPGVKVYGCPWGDAFGSRLNKNGVTIPGYTRTGNAEPLADDANRARWFLLADDPLLELRVLPDETYIGKKPGVMVFQSIPPLATSETVLDLLKGWSVADLWPGFIAGIVTDPEWKHVVEGITASAAAASEKVARSLTAAFQCLIRERAYPNVTGEQRDRLKDAMINPLGGPPLGIGDWLLGRVTKFGANRRGSLSDATTPIVGDVIRYQSRGAEIRNFIAHRVLETQATTILAHSLGGIAAVDWLASPEYAAARQRGDASIERLITAGSQSPYFYEIDALVSRSFGAGLPEWFPKNWINFYDTSDFLSYMAQPAFPDHAKDIQVDNGQPFPESHSSYWNNDRVWGEIAACIAAP